MTGTPERGRRPGVGALVLVATPIGNLGDLSPRAAEALGQADIIACEDTRRSRKLLHHAGVTARRLMAVHAHNEAERAERLVAEMAGGKRVAFVTDGGTPGISDPGERLVCAAIDAGVPVEIVPGPSAIVAALVVSGLPAARFCFEGFLPRKGRERAERLAALARERRTTVVYEAPHRLAATLADLADACGGDRRVAVARELTKLFEEVQRGTLSEAAAKAQGSPPRGEYALVVEGAPVALPTAAEVEAVLRAHLEAGESTRDAVAAAASELRVARRTAYAAALRLRP